MDFKVGLTDEAVADLADIVAFVAGTSPEAALRIGHELIAVAESLTVYPNRGNPIKNRTNMRRILRGKYAIYYRLKRTANLVEVLRIWDCRRDPSELRLS